MNLSAVGLVAGLLLAVVIVAGGFVGFLLALVLGFVGFLVGGQLEGRFDVVSLVRGRRE